jgi:hypothetical protein
MCAAAREGGQRAEYVLDWDLRLSRTFTIARTELRLHASLFNVLNGGNQIAENPFSGPEFNLRPALAIQPPRMFRFGFEFGFQAA